MRGVVEEDDLAHAVKNCSHAAVALGKTCEHVAKDVQKGGRNVVALDGGGFAISTRWLAFSGATTPASSAAANGTMLRA